MRSFHSFAGLAGALLVIFMATTGFVLSLQPIADAATAAPASETLSVATVAERVAQDVPGVERLVRSASGQLVALFVQGVLQGFHIGQDGLCAFGQHLALPGPHDAAALPVGQLEPQLVFDRLQALGDGGWRHIQQAGRGGERGLAGKATEESQVVGGKH